MRSYRKTGNGRERLSLYISSDIVYTLRNIANEYNLSVSQVVENLLTCVPIYADSYNGEYDPDTIEIIKRYNHDC